MPIVLVALFLAWVSALLFGAMEFDRSLILLSRAGSPTWLVTGARWLTELGSFGPLLVATAIGMGLLIARRRWSEATLLLLVTQSGRLLVILQKEWFGRVRPDPLGHVVPVDSFAFPSGHAANATMTFLCLALLLSRSQKLRAAAIWTAVWLAILVGVSRVVLGVHWPSDVVGGWAFGLFWTLAWLRLAGRPLGTEIAPPLVLAGETPPPAERWLGRGGENERESKE